MTTTAYRTVTASGVYDMPNDIYQADPVPAGSLSSSGARRLLSPSCPALFKWERDNERPNRRVFDFGHAAHKLVLGAGDEMVVVDAGDWRTKAAKEERDAAYVQGKVPILAEEYETVEAMTAALLRHPIASALFAPGSGKPEQSLFVQDEQTGVWLRARLDWLPNPGDHQMLLVDYKTAASAEPAAFMRSAANFGYYQQAAWYIDIVKALGLAEDPAFLLVAQEKTAPYLITIFRMDEPSLRIGRIRNRQAIDLFAKCTAADEWPGYSNEVELIGLPAWLADQYEEMTL